MPPSELRREAREALKGKWLKAACIYLIFYILTVIVEMLFDNQGANFFGIKYWISYIISVPLSFGLIISFMKIKRNENVRPFDFFKEGFSRFGKSWGIWFHTFIRILLPVVCFVLIIMLHFVLMSANASVELNGIFSLLYIVLLISTIIYVSCRLLLYVLAHYISFDNPDLSSKECVLKSAKLMKGHRGNYFMLQFSFIGWGLLSAFTFGIGMLFLTPYMQVATICFYEKVLENKEINQAEPAEKV